MDIARDIRNRVMTKLAAEAVKTETESGFKDFVKNTFVPSLAGGLPINDLVTLADRANSAHGVSSAPISIPESVPMSAPSAIPAPKSGNGSHYELSGPFGKSSYSSSTPMSLEEIRRRIERTNERIQQRIAKRNSARNNVPAGPPVPPTIITPASEL
jgi:hypothetical protein